MISFHLKWLVCIVTTDTILTGIVLPEVNLKNCTLLFCGILFMAATAEFSSGRPENVGLAFADNMFLAGTVAGLASYIRMGILSFFILNIPMAFNTGFLT
jgi:hypothetical protein